MPVWQRRKISTGSKASLRRCLLSALREVRLVASRIKGITVEIGGDTTGLDKALKGVNGTIRSTQSSLRDVNRLLKLDPKNTTLLSQKQKLLKESISATKEKLDSLKEAQVQAKQQLENGEHSSQL